MQGEKRNADASEFPEGRLRHSGKFSRPLRGVDRGRVCAPKARRGRACAEAARGNAEMRLWRGVECLCAGACAGGGASAGWLLSASLDGGALVWMPCDVRWPCPWDARGLRDIVAPLLGCWGVWRFRRRYGIVSGDD